MAKSLSISKLASLSKGLSGKERALLVIDFQTKANSEDKSYKTEIDTVLASFGIGDNEKLKEYLFYYHMWHNLVFYSLDLQTALMNIEIYNWRITTIQMYLLHAGEKHEFSKMMNHIPTFYTEEKFVKVYEDCKRKRFEEVLPLDSVSRYETFTSLQNQGLIGEDEYCEFYELPKENEDAWNKTHKDITNQLETAIKEGKLTETEVTSPHGWYHNGKKYVGVRGITAKSWYHYAEKVDTGFNELIDDKEHLIEFYKGNFAIAKASGKYVRKNSKVCDAQSTLDWLKKIIRVESCIVEKEGAIDFEKDVKEALQGLVVMTNSKIQAALNIKTVIERIKNDIYENKINPASDILEKYDTTTIRPRNDLEILFKGLLDIFKPLNPKRKVSIKNRDKYNIVIEPSPDEEFIDEQVSWLISIAEKESNFRWQR